MEALYANSYEKNHKLKRSPGKENKKTLPKEEITTIKPDPLGLLIDAF